MAHLDEYKLLSNRQHAFRKRHSCETQLTTVINELAKILDNRRRVDTFILEFEKAFDTPPHELLKSKLFGYGIGGKGLIERSRVCHNHNRSQPATQKEEKKGQKHTRAKQRNK